MKKRKRLMLVLGALTFGITICILVLVTGDSRVYWEHPGPRPGNWKVRFWVQNVLIQVSPRMAQAVDYNLSRVEHVMTSSKRRTEAWKKLQEELAEWKRDFPWSPVQDTNLSFDFDADLASSELESLRSTAFFNHTFLGKFFKDETRLTLTFKQFYSILNEHDRGHDPVMVALCFRDFRRFHHAAREAKPKGPRMSENLGIQKVLFPDVMWNARVEESFTMLRDRLQDWKWFRPEFATSVGKSNANGLIHRLLYNMEGMEDLPLKLMDYGEETPRKLNQVELIQMAEQGPMVPYIEWYQQYRAHQSETK